MFQIFSWHRHRPFMPFVERGSQLCLRVQQICGMAMHVGSDRYIHSQPVDAPEPGSANAAEVGLINAAHQLSARIDKNPACCRANLLAAAAPNQCDDSGEPWASVPEETDRGRSAESRGSLSLRLAKLIPAAIPPLAELPLDKRPRALGQVAFVIHRVGDRLGAVDRHIARPSLYCAESDGQFMDVKKSPKKFKGVRREDRSSASSSPPVGLSWSSDHSER